jgi:hypothetical protein
VTESNTHTRAKEVIPMAKKDKSHDKSEIKKDSKKDRRRDR